MDSNDAAAPQGVALPPGSAAGHTPRVAIVHEWLEHYAGSERVLERLLVLFPQAELFALVDFVPSAEREFLGGRAVRTSFIQRLPLARRFFRHYLGLMPIAVEQFDFSGFNLVVSSSHAVAKGAITGPDQVHVSYVHSPMRYAWDLQAQYLRQAGLEHGPKGVYARWLLHRLRLWDVRTAPGVDVFVANSAYIARRIRKVYGREAVVVHPPVDTARFTVGDGVRDIFLVASRFVPYKRVDLVVEAFALLPHLRLVVVGDGPERERVHRAASGLANVELRLPVSQAELVTLMQRARAMLFAAEEDFGITTVEAQACGTPVIAYGRGGACDIVVEALNAESNGHGEEAATSATGVLFAKQGAASIAEAVRRFEAASPAIDPRACRANALHFSCDSFDRRFLAVVARAMAGRDSSAIVANLQDA